MSFFQLLTSKLHTTTSSSSLNPTFYSGLNDINMAEPSSTLQVPDFMSLPKTAIIEKLQAYNVDVRQGKTKEALADQLRLHYITNILPVLVQSHVGYLHYNGGMYSFYSKRTCRFPYRFSFMCSRYRHPDKTWTSRYAVTRAYEGLDSEASYVRCQGTLLVELSATGIFSPPQFPLPYHECGCLKTIKTVDLGIQDTRPALEVISPSIAFVDVLTEQNRQAVRKSLSDSSVSWDGLSGGKFKNKSLRKFIRDIDTQPNIKELVERVMAPLVATVRARYPTLQHVKYGALKSSPHCPSQYQGHRNRLHSDYPKFHFDIPPEERPVSIILALDAFDFIYLPHLTLTRKDLVTLQVPAGHGIIFTNACLHSGGANDTNQTKLRLFAYMASDLSHIPHNTVTNYDWSSQSEDATLGIATETGEEDVDEAEEDDGGGKLPSV